MYSIPKYNNSYISTQFRGNAMVNGEEKRIVQTLYEYLNGKINDVDFDNTMNFLFEKFKNNKNNKAWLNTIQKSFYSISDDSIMQEELGCISRDYFKYDILKVLQYLQKNGEYRDIIKKDYSMYR